MATLLPISVLATVLSLLVIGNYVDATQFTVQNKCSYVLTVCDQSQNTAINCYVLGSGGASVVRDVGNVWTGGLFWGYPSSSGDTGLGLQAKPQANLVEIDVPGIGGTDSYDLSNVNAWNLAVLINPTTIYGNGPRNGLTCGTPSCNEGSVNSFCKSPNTLTGSPGNGCYNTDGPNTNVPTTGTEMFKANCESSVSYTTDTSNTIYGCASGSDYEVVFCP